MAKRISKNIWYNIDWITVLIYLILVILGWINIYAAVYNEEHRSIFDISQRYGKQLIWIFLAFVIGLIIFIIDSKTYPMFAYIIYLAIILSLIAVLIWGKEVNSSRSWFEIGDFRLQPAEFAKFATALALANFMNKHDFQIKSFQNLFQIAVIILIPAALILLQPDAGSAIVYIAFILVLYREGLTGIILLLGVLLVILFVSSLLVKLDALFIILTFLTVIIFHLIRRNIKETIFSLIILATVFTISYFLNYYFKLNFEIYKLVSISLILCSLYFVIYSYRKKIYYVFLVVLISSGSLFFSYSVDYIFDNVLEEHQRTRINILIGVETDLKGAGYNVNQSKIAIGSGGLIGKGFLQGTQTKYNFVPEQDTDFIFCTVGEEWGFLGTSVVLLLYLFLLVRIIILAERQRSPFSRIYGYGVASILFFHVIVNIGMTIGLLPVIGIPLPFFSYGGSSLWAFTILLFIFIKLDTSREEVI
jgi:rod shape determining protein RodA